MTAFCFLMAILPLTLFAQDAIQQGQLTDEQQRVFDDRKLSIANYGVRSLQGSHRWLAYQGTTWLREEEFFTLAGCPEASAKVKSYRSHNRKMVAVGSGLTIAGGIAFTVGMLRTRKEYYYMPYQGRTWSRESDPNIGLVIGGSAAIVVGFALAYVYGVDRSSKNWAPASKAQEICDDYNRRLVKEIVKQTDKSKSSP
jgi:hypothetical protein